MAMLRVVFKVTINKKICYLPCGRMNNLSRFKIKPRLVFWKIKYFWNFCWELNSLDVSHNKIK
jgi:hypothetical protein